MIKTPRIVITPGEPAGIGPDVVLQIAQSPWAAELIVIADDKLLIQRAKQLGLPIKLIPANFDHTPQHHQPGILKILPTALIANVEIGILNQKNSPYVIQTLKQAASLCENNIVQAIVTGPVQKSILNDAGIQFSGHTEFFAQLAGKTTTVMLFVTNKMRVALTTTHLPLADVSRAITREKLISVLTILHHDLIHRFHIDSPRIAICGLNPHAGEKGHLGREEIEIISPVINELREKGFTLTDPLSADTLFNQNQMQQYDAILAMYHDQALPVVKYASFGHAVNVTLGLPYIRTSVDHGTALDLAGTGKADAGSMEAAVALAIELSLQHSHS